jgi:membrane protease YdiL (CAAX protease family)
MLSLFSFERIRLKGMLLVALPLGFGCALILTASEQLIHPDQFFSLVDFLQNVSVYSACVLLALLFAEQCKLEGFLITRAGSWLKKAGVMLVYGGLAGIAMGLVHHRWHALYRFSAPVPFRLRRMTTFYDSFILSLSAAVTEELVFRLLLFTSFLWILSWLFQPILTMNGGLNRWIPLVFAVVFSSLLFGFVHGIYGFLFAFGAGVMLCLIFLRGGLESAVLAHCFANLVFFNLTYLR